MKKTAGHRETPPAGKRQAPARRDAGRSRPAREEEPARDDSRRVPAARSDWYADRQEHSAEPKPPVSDESPQIPEIRPRSARPSPFQGVGPEEAAHTAASGGTRPPKGDSPPHSPAPSEDGLLNQQTPVRRPDPGRNAAPQRSLFAQTFYDLFSCRRRKSAANRRRAARRKRRAGARIAVVVCTLFLTVVTALAFCLPLRPTYSEMEQRSLTAFPSASVQSVLDGSFFSQVSTWFSDTFPFREHLTSLNLRLEHAYGLQGSRITGTVETGDEIPDVPGTAGGQSPEDDGVTALPAQTEETSGQQVPEDEGSAAETETQTDEDLTLPDLDDDAKVERVGTLLTIDDAAYEYYNFITSTADLYVSTVNRAADQLDGVARVYAMIVPNSMDICVPESLRANLDTSDQEKAISYMLGSMDSSVTPVNVFRTLLSHSVEGEYLYFRTDHHWTALAAYYAYQDFTRAAGRRTADLETEFTEHVFDNFLGSFYRETGSSAMRDNPDTVYAYEPADTNAITIYWEDGTVTDYTIITDVTDWTATSKYGSAFIGGDNPYSVIENDNITDGSSIVVVKESYGNCFVPFLVQSYQKVYVVDYRYYNDVMSGTLADLVKQEGIQDVLFLNAISATRGSSQMTQLANFVG